MSNSGDPRDAGMKQSRQEPKTFGRGAVDRIDWEPVR